MRSRVGQRTESKVAALQSARCLPRPQRWRFGPKRSCQMSCGHSQSHESGRPWAPQRCVPGRALGF